MPRMLSAKQGEVTEESTLLEEVVQEIGNLDLDLAKKFYKTLWKVIAKSLDEGKGILLPLESSVSIKHHKQEVYLIKKSSSLDKLRFILYVLFKDTRVPPIHPGSPPPIELD